MVDETKSRQEQVLAMHSLNFFFARPFLAPPCSLLPLDVSALELLLREESWRNICRLGGLSAFFFISLAGGSISGMCF